MSIEEAFFSVCKDAKSARQQCVSLYLHTRPYGGPEEGGWWRDDYKLIAYETVSTEDQASALKVKVEKLAEELNDKERRLHNEHCARQMEWLDARGLEADYLPEVNGDSSYYVSIENAPGQGEHHDTGHYE